MAIPSVLSDHVGNYNSTDHVIDDEREPLPPTLMPPGCREITSESLLSDEMRLKREAYIGYFLQQLVRFSMSTASFGLSVAAAVLSGGTGLPMVAVTGTAMVIAAGNACCALYNLMQVRNDRDPLNTGNDCIVLTVKELMKFCGCSAFKSEGVGYAVSFAFRAGIALSLLFLPSAHLSGSIADTLGKVSTGISALLIIIGGGVDTHTALAERKQEYAGVKACDKNAAKLTQEDDDELSEDKIKEIVDQVVACYEQYRARKQGFEAIPAC